MDTRANQAAIEELWRQALTTYRENGLEERLRDEWRNDRNVTERIAYDYPPTFQPGYVGSGYFESENRIVLLGQNPAAGSDAPSRRLNTDYRAKLEEFAREEATFADLNGLIASHMLQWCVFGGKGIFRESGANWATLLPEDVRPSIYEIGYVNYFPFKVASRYRSPLRTRFLKPVWQTYVRRMLELLEPRAIIRFPSSDSVKADLETLPGPPTVLRAWHPSYYNLNAQYWKLLDSWEPVADYLREAARSAGLRDA